MAEHLPVSGVAALLIEVLDGAERQPDVGVEREFEALRHDADNRCRHVVDAHGSPNHRRVAAVAVHKDAVSNERHRRCAGAIVVRGETAAEYRLLAHDPKCRCVDTRAAVSLGRLPFIADVRDATGVDREQIEGARRVSEVAEIEIRHAHVAIADTIARIDGHHAIGVGHRHAADQHGVHEGEHRGVHADAKRQGDSCDEREPFGFQQEPPGKAHILPKTHLVPQTQLRTNVSRGSRVPMVPGPYYDLACRFGAALSKTPRYLRTWRGRRSTTHLRRPTIPLTWRCIYSAPMVCRNRLPNCRTPASRHCWQSRMASRSPTRRFATIRCRNA